MRITSSGAKAQALGYSGMISLSLGQLMNSDKKTWLGENGNLTFQEILKYVSDSDYRKFKSAYSRTEKLYMLSHGFYRKLVDHNYVQYIKTDKKTMLLMYS